MCQDDFERSRGLRKRSDVRENWEQGDEETRDEEF